MKVTGYQVLQVGQHSSSSLPTEPGADYCGVTTFLLRGRGRDHNVTLGIVASGLGSDVQAHRSSQLVGLVLRRHFSQSDSTDVVSLLSGALSEVNRLIYERRLSFLRAGGTPGATLAAAVVFDTQLYTVTVGDSRIYLQCQDSPLIQISVGRSNGPEDSGGSPAAHGAQSVADGYLGQAPTIAPDFRLRLSEGQSDQEMVANQGTELHPGDTVLLTTPGAALATPPAKMERILKRLAPGQAAHRLADASLNGDVASAASVLVMRTPAGRPVAGTWWKRPAVLRIAGGIVALLLAVGAFLGVPRGLALFGSSPPTSTVTPTHTASPTTVPSATAMPSIAPSPTPTASPTDTPMPTPTGTVTPSPTVTPSGTSSPTPSPSPTRSATPTRRRWFTLTPSATPTATWTATEPPPPPPPPPKTSTPLPTDTPVPPPTDTPVPPPTDTPLPTNTPTREIPIPVH